MPYIICDKSALNDELEHATRMCKFHFNTTSIAVKAIIITAVIHQLIYAIKGALDNILKFYFLAEFH